ncbi:membrane protein insertion efficiency factor YidD [Rhizobium sp. XQZ8]|nr:membrane protein insertion efficiency factor YidD [Rhizobium populisoli]
MRTYRRFASNLSVKCRFFRNCSNFCSDTLNLAGVIDTTRTAFANES